VVSNNNPTGKGGRAGSPPKKPGEYLDIAVRKAHAGTNRLYIAHPSLPLYQVTRDCYFLNPGNSYRWILRMLGESGYHQGELDAMKLSLFPNDTLLLGTGSLLRRLPEGARDIALKQFFDDPVQLCHKLITSVADDSRVNKFFNLIVVKVKSADTETATPLQRVQVIHMPEQIVLPKVLRELQK